MSEYPYLSKAIKHYEGIGERRSLRFNERSEVKELKAAKRKAAAFDEWHGFMSYHLMPESGEYYGVDSDKVNAKMIELFDKYESGDSE